jgi:hypothetical protein
MASINLDYDAYALIHCADRFCDSPLPHTYRSARVVPASTRRRRTGCCPVGRSPSLCYVVTSAVCHHKTYLELNAELARVQRWWPYRRVVVRSGACTHAVDVGVEEELRRVSDDDWDEDDEAGSSLGGLEYIITCGGERSWKRRREP